MALTGLSRSPGCSANAGSSWFITSCSARTGTRHAPSCTEYTSEFADALIGRLRSRDTAFAMVCRAPQAKIAAYTAGRGWVLPW